MAADPKFSDMEGEEREQALTYIRARWSQYSSATREARKDAATFIATMNAGGAATVLAFSGAVLQKNGEVAVALPLRLAILCFVIGIALSATAHVIESGRLDRLFSNWRNGVDNLYGNKISFSQLRLDDIQRAGHHELAFGRLVRSALTCFMIGAFFGVILLFGGK